MEKHNSPGYKIVEAFANAMRTDVIACYKAPQNAGDKPSYHPRKSPLTEKDIIGHLNNIQPIGCYVFPQDLGQQGLTRIAVVDIDDKEKKFSWEELCHQAHKISSELEKYWLLGWPCKSGSGHGIHLWLIWKKPQNARRVREVLGQAIARVQTTCKIDLFPAQDAINAGGFGNLVALPFARESRPITNLERGEVASDLSTWLAVGPSFSAPLQEPTTPKPSRKKKADADYGKISEEVLSDALSHIPADEYETWRNVGMALKHSVEAGQLNEESAEEIWTKWASADPKFDQRAQDYHWKQFKPNGKLTIGTVWHLAKENGWDDSSALSSENIEESVEAIDKITELNKKYFIALEGGKLMTFWEHRDKIVNRDLLTRISPSDFKLLYVNQKVIVGYNSKGLPSIKPLGQAWIESAHRRQYKEIVLQPEGCDDDQYNLWRGFTIEPSEQGSCELFKRHILENICSGDEAAYAYIMNWLALTFQKPETPIGTAIVLRGDRGTGKSTFAGVIGQLFGQHYLQVVSSKNLTGRFNAHLRDCILLFADEAIWAGNKSEESTLKGLITEPYICIEGKGRDMYQCRNMIHLIIATNSEWSVPAGLDERRFMALHVGDDKKQNQEYFGAIFKELKEGGSARLLWELLNIDVKDFKAANIPQTEELKQQKMLSLDPWAEWWLAKLQDAYIIDGFEWTDPIPVKALHYDYAHHCKQSGHRWPKSLEFLMGRLKTLLPPIQNSTREYLADALIVHNEVLSSKSRLTFWTLPPLETCREFFEKKARITIAWGDAEYQVSEETKKSEAVENMEIPF